MRPLIVASLPIYKEDDLLKARKIKEADMIELRLDYSLRLITIDSIKSILGDLKDKLILTIRDVSEGGMNKIDDNEKAKYLEEANKEGFIYDIEASFLDRFSIPFKDEIVSVHYFNELPSYEEVERIIEKYLPTARFVKVAVMGKGEYKELLSRFLKFDKIIVLPMGVDPLERIAFGILGSKLIYTFVEKQTAPGQMHYFKAYEIISCLYKE
ncbi:type I 3-dehydroquinate dehydratase [Acidianus sp. HS-5]|uniref:type I 3-dehydroquinate dehydratase n=1 Tax=Acidianus sp. HS-5 TaxID=2886040 RepID=UPI001F021616|nr:type I 3-dehydroquinate dehydratase [Acidianus sp. HS-5]BDC19720.1 3-dehydroquinase [Acidianus sp. HS-5]